MSRSHLALLILLSVMGIGPVVITLLLSLAPMRSAINDRERPALYFPTQVGTRWIYQESDGRERTEAVTAVEERGSAKLVTVSREIDGAWVPLANYAVSERGVCLTRYFIEHFDPPQTLLKSPFDPGLKWQELIHYQPGNLKWSYTVRGTEQITIPPGTFAAVRVDAENRTETGIAITRLSWWFAPNIGIVQERVDGRLRVMKSFAPHKE